MKRQTARRADGGTPTKRGKEGGRTFLDGLRGKYLRHREILNTPRVALRGEGALLLANRKAFNNRKDNKKKQTEAEQ